MDGIPFDHQPAARIPEMDPHPVPGSFRTVKLGSVAQEFLPVNVPLCQQCKPFAYRFFVLRMDVVPHARIRGGSQPDLTERPGAFCLSLPDIGKMRPLCSQKGLHRSKLDEEERKLLLPQRSPAFD